MSNSFKYPIRTKSVPVKARRAPMGRRQATDEVIYMTFSLPKETLLKDTSDGFFCVFPEARKVDLPRAVLRPRPSIRQNRIAVIDHLRMPASDIFLSSATTLCDRSSTFSTPTQAQLPQAQLLMRITSRDESSAKQGSSDSAKQTSRIPDGLFLPMF
jgi:hypothetical protein